MQKKIVSISLFFILCCSSVIYSSMKTGFSVGYQSIEGYKVGVALEIDINDQLAFLPELCLSVRKYQYPYPDMICYGCYSQSSLMPCPDHFYLVSDYESIKYIELPFQFKYRLSPEKRFSPYILGGIYTAFRISRDQHNDYWYHSNWQEYADTDAGLICGIGFDIKKKSVTLSYGIKYNFGLIDALESQFFYYDAHISYGTTPINSGKKTRKNRSVTVQFGVFF